MSDIDAAGLLRPSLGATEECCHPLSSESRHPGSMMPLRSVVSPVDTAPCAGLTVSNLPASSDFGCMVMFTCAAIRLKVVSLRWTLWFRSAGKHTSCWKRSGFITVLPHSFARRNAGRDARTARRAWGADRGDGAGCAPTDGSPDSGRAPRSRPGSSSVRPRAEDGSGAPRRSTRSSGPALSTAAR